MTQQKQEPVRKTSSNTRHTVAVEGQALTYWDNVHDAITHAQRAVYSGPTNTTRALDDLKAGRIAEWSYGFSAVRIYPPQSTVPPQQKQEPVANGKLKVTLQDTPTEIELAQYKRMFEAACTELGAINEALGLDPNEGGAEPILAAIEELKASPPQRQLLTDRQMSITLFALQRLMDSAHRMANAAAQDVNDTRFKPGDVDRFLADAKVAIEAYQVLEGLE